MMTVAIGWLIIKAPASGASHPHRLGICYRQFRLVDR